MRQLVIWGFAMAVAAAAQTPIPAEQQGAPMPGIEIGPLLEAANASYLKGDYKASLDGYRQAEALVEQTPPENPQRYDVLKRLVSACSATGDTAMAIAYLQQAIDWRKQVMGPDDPKILTDMIQSADLYRANEDFKTARKILDAVLAAHMKSPGPDTVETADDHSRIALLLLGQKKSNDREKIDAAVPEFETAIAIRIRAVGPLDMALVPDLDRIGPLYIAQTEYEKAEGVFRRALVIRESLLGSESADLIPSVDGLAYAYFGEKNYDAAEAMYQRLLKLWEKSVGPTHPMMAMALDKLAVFYAAQAVVGGRVIEEKQKEAMEAYEHANAIRAYFYANGESAEAAQALTAGDMAGAVAQYERGLKVLDPANPVYDELKETMQTNVKALDQVLKTPPSGVKVTLPKK